MSEVNEVSRPSNTPKTVRLQVPATSANLGPGFDCLGLALDRHLTLESRPATAFELHLEGEGAGQLPRDATNLLVRALRTGTGRESLPAVTVRVNNRIPLARGLGSSAAATVAGLALGRVLGGEPPAAIDRHRLLVDATRFEGHPDNVAPAIHGDLVVSGGQGGADDDTLVAIREHWPAALRLVLVVPDCTIETEAARHALPATLDFATAVRNSGRLARLLAALRGGCFEHLRTALEDELHQPFRLALAPQLAPALEHLHTHPDSLGAYLSGSGSALIALTTSSAGETIGVAACALLASTGLAAWSRVIDVDRHGLRVEVGD